MECGTLPFVPTYSSRNCRGGFVAGAGASPRSPRSLRSTGSRVAGMLVLQLHNFHDNSLQHPADLETMKPAEVVFRFRSGSGHDVRPGKRTADARDDEALQAGVVAG